VAGCEGYGCEPVFALAYVGMLTTRARIAVDISSPRFGLALEKAGLVGSPPEIIEQVMQHGTCQDIPRCRNRSKCIRGCR